MEAHGLAGEIEGLLNKVDKVRYAPPARRQEVGHAGLTSCSDGKFIYTWFADGVAVCHDLEGKRKWMTLQNEGPRGGTENDQHGYYTSPLLTDTEFVVRMTTTHAFDKATGKVLWKTGVIKEWPPPPRSEPLTAPGTDSLVYTEAGVHKPGGGFFAFSGGTVAGGRFYVVGIHHGTVSVWEIPKTFTKDTSLKHLGGLVGGATENLLIPAVQGGFKVQGSVLVHEGIVYSVTMSGPFRAHDEQTKKLVYSTRIDLNTFRFFYPYPYASGVCASPTLGGKNIYMFGNGGSALVIKPGRTFEVVAENRIERLQSGFSQWSYMVPSKANWYPECTVSSPIFEGQRIYLQGEGYLYCIGKAK